MRILSVYFLLDSGILTRLDYRCSGQYFVPLAKLDEPSKLAQDDELAKELWEFSETIVKEKLGSLS